MEKVHAEKVHSTYENHNENIGKKTTLYVKTTSGKTANYVKMGRGPVGEWPSGCRTNIKHLGLTIMKRELQIL